MRAMVYNETCVDPRLCVPSHDGLMSLQCHRMMVLVLSSTSHDERGELSWITGEPVIPHAIAWVSCGWFGQISYGPMPFYPWCDDSGGVYGNVSGPTAFYAVA